MELRERGKARWRERERKGACMNKYGNRGRRGVKIKRGQKKEAGKRGKRERAVKRRRDKEEEKEGRV